MECSEKLKTGSDKLIKFLWEKKKDLWKELEVKYDSKNLYRIRYTITNTSQ